MADIINAEERAGEIYRHYLESDNGDPEDAESTITDMIVDLLLLCRSLDFDVDKLLWRVKMHYDAEVSEHLETL